MVGRHLSLSLSLSLSQIYLQKLIPFRIFAPFSIWILNNIIDAFHLTHKNIVTLDYYFKNYLYIC